MTWKDVLPRGEKGRLIQRVRNATDDLPQDIIDGAMFYIGGNIGWRTVAGKVRDLVDFLSNERNGSGDLRYTLDGREMGHAHNCSHSKCIVFRRVKKFTNWGHHACNDRSFPHTDITGENQNRMVDALIDILSWCGAFNSYDDSDTDDSNDYTGSTDEGYDSGGYQGSGGSDSDGDGLCDEINNLDISSSDSDDALPAVCRFWERGTCRFGENCRYRHWN